MAVDYDIPDAPNVPAGGAGAGAGAAIDGSASASMFDGVPDIGEPIPVGTYHFRLAKYTHMMTTPTEEEKAKGEVPEPYYNLEWVCQQEPHVGRIHFENCPWVRQEVIKAATAGDPVARKALHNRLPRAKNIMEAAGYKPVGDFDFERDFLSTNPEILIQLGLQPKKSRNPQTGKLEDTGDFRNKTVKYYPIGRR